MSCDCVLVGKLTKDCETKTTKNGKLLYCLSVASNRGFGDKQETDFFDCMAFHPLLEKQAVHLIKGTLVKIVGHFQSHESANGVRRWTMIIDSLEMIWQKKRDPKQERTDNGDVDLPF